MRLPFSFSFLAFLFLTAPFLLMYTGVKAQVRPDITAQRSLVNAESHPIVSADGNILFFARSGHPQNVGQANRPDIWQAVRQADGSWSRPINLGRPLNNDQDNYPVGLTNNGSTLFFISVVEGGKKELYQSELHGRIWSMPQPLFLTGLDTIGELVDFQVSLNGRTAMAAIRQQEESGVDLFYCTLTDPQNWSCQVLPDSFINTSMSEYSPYLAADEASLFFIREEAGVERWYFARSDKRAGSTLKFSHPIPAEDYFPEIVGARQLVISLDGENCYLATGQSAENVPFKKVGLPADLRPKVAYVLSGSIYDSETEKPLGMVFKSGGGQENPLSTSPHVFFGKYQVVQPVLNPESLLPCTEGYLPLRHYLSETVYLADEASLDYDVSALVPGEDGVMGDKLQAGIAQWSKLLNGLEEWYTHSFSGDSLFNTIVPHPVVNNLASGKKPITSRSKAYQIERGVHKERFDALFRTEDTQPAVLSFAYMEEGITENLKVLHRQPLQLEWENDSLGMTRIDTSASINQGEKELPRTARKTGYRDEKIKEDQAWLALKFAAFEYQIRLEAIKRRIPEMASLLTEVAFTDLSDEIAWFLEEGGASLLPESAWVEIKNQVFAELKDRLQKIVNSRLGEKVLDKMFAVNPELEQLGEDMRLFFEKEEVNEIAGNLYPLAGAVGRDCLSVSLRKKVENALRTSLEIYLKRNSAGGGIDFSTFSAAQSSLNPVVSDEEIETGGFIVKDMVMTPVKPGMIIPLGGITFEASTINLKPESIPQLKAIVQLMIDYPELSVEVSGHGNAVCHPLFSETLSKLRAEQVAKILIENGVDASRVFHKGYGMEQLLYSGTTKAEQLQNQRIELKIIRFETNKNQALPGNPDMDG